jgi:uncharacterized protein YkwD
MFFTKQSLLRNASIFSFALLLLVLVSPTQITFAQAPQVFPVARLLSLPSDSVRASRPRRVLWRSVANTSSPSLGEATQIERRAFEMTNTARLQNGLAPLVWDPALCRMARIHSENMVRLGYFAHETPDGLHLKDRAHAVGIPHFRVLGENIAYNQGYDDPGAFAVQRWLISPGHRANILSNEFEQAAIGSFVAPDGTVYLTQEFIRR